MSLSAQDEEQLLEWFGEKENKEKDSDEYFKFRDKIFSHVLNRLSDYFSVLKMEWGRKYHLSDDDCVSIIHDGLLASVDNFKLHYKSKDRVIKFITYLTSILKNLAMDYARRNHIRYDGKGKTRKLRKMENIPSSLYVSLDYILETMELQRGQTAFYDGTQKRSPYVKPLLDFINESKQDSESKTTQALLVHQLLEKLSNSDRYVLQSIMEGYSLSDIAKTLDLTKPGIKYRIKRLSKKFDDIKKELWESEKPS